MHFNWRLKYIFTKTVLNNQSVNQWIIRTIIINQKALYMVTCSKLRSSWRPCIIRIFFGHHSALTLPSLPITIYQIIHNYEFMISLYEHLQVWYLSLWGYELFLAWVLPSRLVGRLPFESTPITCDGLLFLSLRFYFVFSYHQLSATQPCRKLDGKLSIQLCRSAVIQE